MSNTPRQVTRNQLAEFLPNARVVRAFEQMLKQVGELLPADVVTLNRLIEETTLNAASADAKAQSAVDTLANLFQLASINSGMADAKATAALDALVRIAKALDLLSLSTTSKDNSLTTDYVDFALVPRYAATPGRVHWGSTGTLEIEMGGGNITQQVGEEFFVYGKATAAITEGQLIMVTGAVGASGTITFAPTSTGIIDPNAILGIATENIALNGFGRVTTMGVVHGINTTGSSVGEVWADGDTLWYNTAVVGSMTKVKPVAPNMKTQVAIVINAGSGGSGSLQVEIVHGSTLGGTDANVQLGALVDKQLLQYDATAGYWKNVAVSTVGSTAAETHAAASKATPVDADELPLADSASSFSLKKLTWANLKATLATWIGGNLIAGSFTSLVSSTTGKVATTLGVGNATPAASGAGISFPATLNASSDANTLDDYEEGTWSPTLTGSVSNPTGLIMGGGPTGNYVKVGRMVHAYYYAGSTTWTGAGSGILFLSGLPFSGGSAYLGASIANMTLLPTCIFAYQDTAGKVGFQAANTTGVLGWASAVSGGSFMFSIVYRADA
jgi:hypothetical protein